MKIPSVILIVLILSLPAFAQKKGFVSLSGGIGIPKGDFGGDRYEGDHIGFAKTGPFLEILAGHTVFRRLGVLAMFRSQYQPFNDEGFEYRLWLDDYIDVSSDPWKLYSGLAGIYFSQPITKRFSVEPKVLCGATFAKPPNIYETYHSYNGMTFESVITGPVTTSFALLLGFTISFNLSEKIHLLASVDYMKSRSKYKESIYYKDKGYYSPYAPNVNKAIGLVNIGFGISYCW